MRWICSPNSIETIRTVMKPSGKYWNCPDSMETIRTVLKPSGQYWNHPDNIAIVRRVFKLSKQYFRCPNSIQTVQTVFKLSKQYLNCANGIQTVPKQSKLSEANSLKPSILPGNGLHCANKCWPFRLLLHINRAKSFRTSKFFPFSNNDGVFGSLLGWRLHPPTCG